tara:strand:+ start:363 stop:1115 length:753 start_codon:yes stop_codon:yes gene_type:complete
MKLEGLVAIVTGGGSGIGESTVKLFANQGASVVIADIDYKNAERVSELVQKSGGKALALQVDVSIWKQVEAMVQATLTRFGGLNILVNLAGRQVHTPVITEVTEDEWDKVMEINLKGVFLCTKAALPIMVDSGQGVIVNVSSANVLEGETFSAPYSVSKAGVEMFTKITSSQYRRTGVRVNCILPGLIDTPGSQNVEGKLGTFDSFVETIPSGRSGFPEEVADLILFLASEDSSFISGSSVVIDGGRDAK